MRLNNLKSASKSRKTRQRVGRGPGSGRGKTAARGQKGQRARSGGKVSPGFEGGQMPLQRRLPKRGFRNPFRKTFAVIHVGDLDRFAANSVVDMEALCQAGLVNRVRDGVKVLSDGEMTRPITLRVHKVSRKTREKIEAAGGTVEERLT
jgi:large subunit ribosomal protein L15